MNTPRLSAVMLAGDSRRSAQRVLNALCRQTIAPQMEIVVVDIGASHLPALEPAGDVPVQLVRRPDVRTWSEGRLIGIKAAHGEVLAFIEDHCTPEPDWAEHVLAAYAERDWAAVGYSFTNGSPDTYLHRASLVADYGPWMHPAPAGESRLIPGNNVAYKREFLLSFGDELQQLMAVDFNLHEIILQRGLSMCIQPAARAAHQSYRSLAHLMSANHVYARMMASARSRNRGFTLGQRLLWGLVTPWAVPTLRLLRLIACLRSRPALWSRTLLSLPITLPVYVAAACGESLGYLRGEGSAAEEFFQWELNKAREMA